MYGICRYIRQGAKFRRSTATDVSGTDCYYVSGMNGVPRRPALGVTCGLSVFSSSIAFPPPTAAPPHAGNNSNATNRRRERTEVAGVAGKN